MSVPEVGLYDDATPDEQIAYCMGWNTARAIDQAAAFGAIRRAAAVARYHEWEARIIECGSTDFAKRLAAEHFCLAKAVRRAIRAAIGDAS